MKEKLIKETSWGIAAKAVAFPAFFITNIYLARVLGPEKWGTWSYFYSIFTIVFLFSLFGVRATSKFFAQHNGTEEIKEVHKSAFFLRFCIIACFSLFLFLLSKPLTSILARYEFSYLLQASSLMLFLSGITEHFKGVFLGLHKIKNNFLITSTEFCLKLLAVVILFEFFSVKIINIVWGFSAALFVSTLLGFWLSKREIPNGLKRLKDTNRAYVREIFNYSVPLFLISIGFAVATEIDTIMIGWLNTDIEVGLYAIPKQIVTKLPHISYAIAMGTMPVFAKMNRDNHAELKALFRKLVGYNALFFVAVAIAIIVTAPFIIPLLFGIEYSGSILPLQILTGYLLVFTLSVFFNQFLDYQGYARKRAINLVLSLLVNFILNLFLIPKYGAVGAAISTSVSYIPYLLLNMLEVRNVMKQASLKV